MGSFVSRGTLLELRSELSSYTLPVTTEPFSGIPTHGTVTVKPRLLCNLQMRSLHLQSLQSEV